MWELTNLPTDRQCRDEHFKYFLGYGLGGGLGGGGFELQQKRPSSPKCQEPSLVITKPAV